VATGTASSQIEELKAEMLPVVRGQEDLAGGLGLQADGLRVTASRSDSAIFRPLTAGLGANDKRSAMYDATTYDSQPCQ